MTKELPKAEGWLAGNLRELDARAVSLQMGLGGRNVQSRDGYPMDPAQIMVEVFSGKD